MSGRRVKALVYPLVAGAFMAVGLYGAPAASASVAPLENTAPELGINFYADGHSGQCTGPNQQWALSPDWTTPIRLDTDNRSGGCQLGFGVYDPSSVLAGLALDYTWSAGPVGGDPGQCGNRGTHALPINSTGRQFGSNIRVDTDNRSGWCELTLNVAGRTDIAVDVQYYADGDAGQCPGHTAQGQYRTARSGAPVTVRIDTDNRGGGCWLSLRLRRIGF